MALCASLLEAASRGDAVQVVRLLRIKSCDINVVDENGCTALQRAAADGHVPVLEVLLKHGADPNKQDIVHGNTAAHEAAWKGYSRCLAQLAAASANLHVRNLGGFAPLHLACQNGHNQSCREILLAGAHPDIQNNYGDTSLHTSARYGHAGVTRILISADCSVSEQNKNGDTALHIAAAMGRRKLTRILLEAGCDKALRNKQDETARDIATRKDLKEILQILNMSASKPKKDKKKAREKSKERSIDVPDAKKNEKTPEKGKEKKKGKTVTFEPAQKWSPYGCHYYPDPKSFPKPKLDSLPNEPLKKGEQYYLDLAGNIRKGPIGVGYTCYCAPFFKHMEEKLNKDKQELKQHIDKAHKKLDQKVTDLETKTQGQISELTRCVAAERTLCRERHLHLEQWVTRGMVFRASERVKKLEYSPKGSLDIPPLKRTKSLEILDPRTREWNKVNNIIKSYNQYAETYETGTKEQRHTSKQTSKSTEMLDGSNSSSVRRRHLLKGSRSTETLDRSPGPSERSCRSPGINITHYTSSSMQENDEQDGNMHNITAEIHIKSQNASVSQSPIFGGSAGSAPAYSSPSRHSQTKSPQNGPGISDQRTSDSDCDIAMRSHQILNGTTSQNAPTWKSQVLQRAADDIRKRLLEKEMPLTVLTKDQRKTCFENISQDGYIKIPKHGIMYPPEPHFTNASEIEQRTSVQEMVARVEEQQSKIQREACSSPDPAPRLGSPPTSPPIQNSRFEQKHSLPPFNVPPEQPLRPAPILKDTRHKDKSKRFSLHNLIPFPTRKTFQPPSKDAGDNSESSDEDDGPIRSTNEPGPMRNTNLLKTLPLPNYENMRNQPQMLVNPHPTQNTINSYPQEANRSIPKDAYFHEIPNRQRNPQTYFPGPIENGLPNSQYTVGSSLANVASDTNGPVIPILQNQNINMSRNRNPLYHPTGIFDAMMQDHMVREMERTPHCYSGHLDPNTEIEIANDHESYFDRSNTGLPVYPPHGVMRNHMNEHLEIRSKPQFPPDHNLLHSRLQSLAINTQLSEMQSQIDRESHNDSGYSTKVYGSSQGPSPSLSGNAECMDGMSSHRINIGNGKPAGVSQNMQIGASSLV